MRQPNLTIIQSGPAWPSDRILADAKAYFEKKFPTAARKPLRPLPPAPPVVPLTPEKRERRGQKFEYRGEWKTLKEWADITGRKYPVLAGRVLRLGWPIAEAIERVEDLRLMPKQHRVEALRARKEALAAA